MFKVLNKSTRMIAKLPTNRNSDSQTETSPPQMARSRVIPRVVVVGAGFGGLSVARNLAGSEVNIVVLDRSNYHGFWPLLYQVATAGLEPESIAHPVRSILRKHRNVDFQMAEVTGIDFDNRLVYTDGEPVAYDYLVLAAGSAANYFGNDALAEQTYSLKDIDEAVRLRNRILSAFEHAVREKDAQRRNAMLTFVIVGGGPTGVELSGAFAELIREVLRKDYPMLDVSEAHILLVEAMSTILMTFPESLREEAKHQLEKMGVEVKLNTALESVNNGRVKFKDGTEIEAETVVWTAGVRGALLGDDLGIPLARGARVPVEPTLTLPSRPEVFVIGDMASLTNPKTNQPYPMVAQVAIQEGKRAARNLLAQVRRESMLPFQYFDKGNMATIGRKSAVLDVFGMQLTGFLAWIAWLIVHITFLIGSRSRLVVLTNWAYNYFTYDRATRLISKPTRK
jgi:NADH:ubiquinone reductase (H+-translocating)